MLPNAACGESNERSMMSKEKRELLISGKELSEKELLTSIKKNEKCFKYLEKKEIKKVIYVKNKLINIII